ncbi:MAG TPA: cytochrome c [Chitinophagaceae bacterium]|nr:cytochrome c [Chitinophagaceae bacterium]
MKKLLIIAGMVATGAGILSCNDKESPGRVYMPDMAYSRAYEAYGYNNVGDHERLKQKGAFYNQMPVAGTVARGEMMPYHLTADSAGIRAAETLINPLDTFMNNKVQLKEAERIYLINCGICHGTKLDGNGPLWNNGDGPYPAAPRSLITDEARAWTDGHYFHVITFGKGQMGSYASQLRPEQRWWVINYIRTIQGKGAKIGGTDSTAGGTAAPAASDATTGATTTTTSTQ